MPIVVLHPQPDDHRRSRQRKISRYRPLVENLERRGLRYFEVLRVFEERAARFFLEELTVAFGHYSPRAHGILVRALLDDLERQGLLDREVLSETLAEEKSRHGATSG
ncbi:MAG: hypothetical protein GY769_15630 [bacterium]|nr:hypothetical protein [bacterium]